jgi:hypothetical protein
MMRTCYYLIPLAGIALMPGCKQQEPTAPEIGITASESPPVPVPLPVADAPLDRQAILLAASQAASNYALGKDDADAQRKLDGKRFSIRMRFGCRNSQKTAASQPRSWSFDEKRRVLSFKIMLDVDIERSPAAGSPQAEVEAVEGFWIERPWMLQAGCPRPETAQVTTEPASPKGSSSERSAKPDQPAEPVEPTSTSVESAEPWRQVGIAQFFLDTDARTHRREHRAYETTKVLAAGVAPSPQGYDLVVAGRLRRLMDGRVIACRIDKPGVPPRCLVSIQMENVSIETPGGGGTVATWSGA